MAAATTELWTFPQRLGVFFTILAASLSLTATVSILAYAGFRSAKRWTDAWQGKARIARPSDAVDSALFINLILMDALEALGVFPNIRWMNDAMITAGPLCTIQAVMKNFSGVGIATAALAIAVHSFSIIVLDWKPRRHATAMIILAVWTFTALIVIIPNGLVRHELYGNAGYWCWIRSTHKGIQISNHYLWLWLDGILLVVFYSIVFAVVRRWLIIDNGKLHWHKNYTPLEHDREEESDEDKEMKAIAMKMLLYPAVYFVLVFPFSLARWLYFMGHNPQYQFTLSANTLYTLSGVCDVALFLATRPEIIGRGPISITPNNRTDSIQMIPTTHAINSREHGHLPTRHINIIPGLLPERAEQYLNNKLVGRDSEIPLTLRQDRSFQVEYGRSSDRQRESAGSSSRRESSLYENPIEHRRGPSARPSLGQLGPETEVYGKSVSSRGYVPPADRGRPRTAPSASTDVEEGQELGYLPK